MKYLVKDIEILKDIVNIEIKSIDGIKKYRIHAVAFANYFVSKEQNFDDDFLSKLLKESDFYFIKDKVINKLKVKDYSKNEIINYLSDKLDEYEIDRLIKDLEKNNYINDYNYVKRIFVLAQSKLKGRVFIINYLKDKDIDDRILSAFFDNFNEKDLAGKLVKNEINKLIDKYPKNILINKISYKLNYNGFSEDIIREEINNLEYLKCDDNYEMLQRDCLKLLKKYQNKLKNKELERKVIESLLLKGYNYKSVKNIVEGMIKND